jgi:hypothetical protein
MPKLTGTRPNTCQRRRPGAPGQRKQHLLGLIVTGVSEQHRLIPSDVEQCCPTSSPRRRLGAIGVISVNVDATHTCIHAASRQQVPGPLGHFVGSLLQLMVDNDDPHARFAPPRGPL